MRQIIVSPSKLAGCRFDTFSSTLQEASTRRSRPVVSHIEGGDGTRGKIVKFQLRPDPLAK